ncbi:MAG TPA: hypothetical protein VGK32_07860 [Vicinamibacterales bacterium]
MVIKRSSAREVSGLLQDIEAGPDVAREAAVARLSVIGTRAVEGLLALLTSTRVQAARVAALAALEAIGDHRAIEPAQACLEGPDDLLRGPAAGLLRRLLDSPQGTAVLDRLTAVVLDTRRPAAVRLAALDALRNLPAPTLEPLRNRLREDPDEGMRAAGAEEGGTPAAQPPLEALDQAAAAGLPDDPARLKRWLAADGERASLPTLHRLIERLREMESRTGDPTRRGEWMLARASVHQALAAQGSTVALYDLRETIEQTDQAPVEMLAAVGAIGDKSCLEAIAAACARMAPAHPPDARRDSSNALPTMAQRGSTNWWRDHLIAAFRAIAERERLTERHALTRRIRARWPDTAAELLGPPKR